MTGIHRVSAARRARLGVGAAIAGLVLLGCSKPQLLVFFSKPYWNALGPSLTAELSTVAQRHGLSTRIVTPGISEAVSDSLTKELRQGSVDAVVVDPLLSSEAADVAQRFGTVTFILMDGPDQPLSNTIDLRFDRSSAFKNMGRAVAAALRENPELASGPPPPGPERNEVAVLVLSRFSTDAETEAFSDGVAETGQRPLVKEIPEPLDRAAVVATVKALRAEGYQVFFPRLGELNGACLETLATEGGYAVTEDWVATQAYPAQVFLSVEEDVPAGIDACLSARDAKQHFVTQGAFLVSGKARKIPAGFESIVR